MNNSSPNVASKKSLRRPANKVLQVLVGVSVLAMMLCASAMASGKSTTRLTANLPVAATSGSPVNISGRLTSAMSGKGLRRERVGLYRESSGSGRFVLLATAVTTRSGSYRFSLALSPGAGVLAVKFAGNERLRGAVTKRKLTETSGGQGGAVSSHTEPVPATTTTPAEGRSEKTEPTAPPAPSTLPPPPPPPFLSMARQKSSPAAHAADAFAVTFGGQECLFNQVVRTFPLVPSPTGTDVFAVNTLYAIPSNGSGTWRYEGISDYYYNGTYRPVYDWYDYQTGQVGAGDSAMAVWNINAGWTADIIQWVWDSGQWYPSVPQPCSFS
jgi:hypothetical protein